MIDDNSNSFIKVARIVGAFGIRGLVRVTLFSDNSSYLCCFLRDGCNKSETACKVVRYIGKNNAVLSVDGVCDRTSAEFLKGKFLYIKRSDLESPKEDEFYVCDLIGKPVRVIGEESANCIITNVFNFGASDLLEISNNNRCFLIPFTKENFPDSDDGICMMTKDAWNWYKG